MTISFDGGKTMMNFAEAALLIQGSTCIYGRKVSFSLAIGMNLADHNAQLSWLVPLREDNIMSQTVCGC